METESVLNDLAKRPEPPLQFMTSPPDNDAVRGQIGDQMWTGLLLRFSTSLSPVERQLWENPPADFIKSREHMALLHRFDDFILKFAAEFGWRLLMSYGFLQRVSEWEKHAPELLERLGVELARRSRIFRGEEQAPLLDNIDRFADEVIPELRMLLRRLRDELGSRPVRTCARIAAWMKEEIESRQSDFPLLCAEIAQLCSWVETLPKRNKVLALTLAQGALKEKSFFYQWYADLSGRSQKDIQNKISAMRAERRRHSAIRAR